MIILWDEEENIGGAKTPQKYSEFNSQFSLVEERRNK